MEHPYDRPPLETSLAATLSVFRERGAAPSPNQEMVKAAERVSAPLAAFAHTLGSYLPGPDFGRFETTAEVTDDGEDWGEDLGGAGCNMEDCLLIGIDGGGVEHLFMVGNEEEAGYALYLWAMDGEAYPASGKPVWRVGNFADLFRHLRDKGDDLDDRLASITE